MKTTRCYSILLLIFSNFTSIVHSTTSTLIGKTPATSTIIGNTPVTSAIIGKIPATSTPAASKAPEVYASSKATGTPTLAQITTSSAIANENRSRYKIFGKIELINTKGMVDYGIFLKGHERQLDEFLGREDFPSLARQQGQKMYLAAINKGNADAFEKLIIKKINPYKEDPDFCMSAYQYLKSRVQSEINTKMMEMIVNNKMIFLDSESKLQSSPKFSCRETKLPKELKYKHYLRNLTFFKFNILLNDRKKMTDEYTFKDGSNKLHQAILGNNLETVLGILETKDEVALNKYWANKVVLPKSTASSSEELEKYVLAETLEELDVGAYTTLDPRGWTPLMLAVALNRYEIVKAMTVKGSGVDITKGWMDLDARVLARSLPLTSRFAMLKLIVGDRSDLLGPAATANVCKNFKSLKLAIEGGADENCLNYFSWKGGSVDFETISVAVEKLENSSLEVFLEENVLVSNAKMFEAFWKGLKNDSKSSEINLTKKISYLSSFGFELDNPKKLDYTITPWGDCLKGTSLIRDELIGSIIRNGTLVNVNKLENYNESPAGGEEVPILIALKNNKVNVVKLLLNQRYFNTNTTEIKGAEKESKVQLLDLDNPKYFSDKNEENLMHLAIVHIKDQEKLIEIVDLILKTKKSVTYPTKTDFLDKASFYSSTCDQVIVPYKEGSISMVYECKSGWTPLMYALILRKDRVANHLAKLGANLEIKGKLDYCAQYVIGRRCALYKLHLDRLPKPKPLPPPPTPAPAPPAPVDPTERNLDKIKYIEAMVEYISNILGESAVNYLSL